MKTIGVLAFHGDVIEHITATQKSAEKLKIPLKVVHVRTKKNLIKIDGLIIPGGESTTLYKLCEREGMWKEMKKIKNIFGTCAGAIILSKKIYHQEKDQKTLGVMDIEVDRNAYGRQTESFEKSVKTSFGDIQAVFIRAPKIIRIGSGVRILVKDGREIIACEQRNGKSYFLAACFHPELTATVFHEYFLRQI